MNLSETIEHDDHKMVCCFSGKKSGLRGFISIHRGNQNFPSFGATRIWNYKSEEEALKDSLKLSKLMSYKAAMAGLKCGGAKATIISNENNSNSKLLLKAYAERVNFLGGRFVTGADVGVSRNDVIFMRRYSPYIVGVLVNPVRFTGLGLFLAVKACVKEVFTSDNLINRSFAVQGVGKIGLEIIKHLYPYTKNIVITDIDRKAIDSAVQKFPSVKVVKPNEIYSQKVDVFSPCALGGSLNKEVIPLLKCQIIAGGANNQLENEEIAEKIYKRNILYAPDYVVNAGGLISVYDEYENKSYRINRIKGRVKVVEENIKKIISISKKSKRNTSEVADELARKIFDNLK